MRKIITIRRIRTIRGRRSTGKKFSRPYVNKRNRFMLGEGKRIKKQRGGFIAPLAAALAGPALELFGSLIRR